MTDPVNGISGAQGTSSGGSYSGGGFPDRNKKKRVPTPQDDLIEISQDARNRSTGSTKKGLWEYLKSLFE